jgi:hypothetical protein
VAPGARAPAVEMRAGSRPGIAIGQKRRNFEIDSRLLFTFR